MQPRLSSSRKWTAVPEELIEQIKSVFQQSFREHVKGGTVAAQGRIYPSEILIGVGYRAQNSLRQSTFEVSITYKPGKDNVLKLLHMAIDAAGSLFDLFFKAENDQEFPRIWEEIDFEGRTIHIQYSTANWELDSEADKLLGEAEAEELARGEWDEDLSPEDIKAGLGIDPDDALAESEIPQPKSSKKKKTTH